MPGSRYAARKAQFNCPAAHVSPQLLHGLSGIRWGTGKVTSGQMVSNSERRTREREDPDPVLWRRRQLAYVARQSEIQLRRSW